MDGAGFSRMRLSRMREVMARHVERGELPGLVALVSRHGETEVEAIGTMAVAASRPMQRDTIFRIASLAKPVTAVAAMILVEQCRLRLDDPVDELLPELAGRRVLRRIEGPLEDTVPAVRPITLRDLLTFTWGFGTPFVPQGPYPIQKAMAEAGLDAGADHYALTPDEWMRRLGDLPLIYQPGEAWVYHTGSDVLGVLIGRAAGQSLERFLAEHIFEPLGMRDTGFHVPAEKLDRLASSYMIDGVTGEFRVHDEPASSRWRQPPVFASGGGSGGLVSTADDYAAFCRMLLNKGRLGNTRVLSRPSVELMTMNHLTLEQRAAANGILGPNEGWGFGMAVSIRRDDLATSPGRFGWNGGTGTSAYSDPAEGLVGILLTQRLANSPGPPAVYRDFWTSAYQAIDD